jgi:NADPH:quinone reductase-like Zn-dependent oxidoreductase
MRAVRMHETGGPEVLRLEEVAAPEPGEGEVLIRVRAASVNPIDWKWRRTGTPRPLPAVLGVDVSGTVEASRSDDFDEGDEVFGVARSGAYAELAAASAARIAAKPAEVGHAQAAALPVAGGTAWQGLYDRGGLQAGQTALIAGAAGGVGHLAVQFAKHTGTRTMGIGSSRNRDFVLGLGADEYVDYTQRDVAEAASGVDLAFDTVGGGVTASLLSTVREGGVLITIAGAAPDEAAQRGVRAEMFSSDAGREELAQIAELVAAGEVRVEIAQRFPLDEVAQAHALSESGHTRGKIVIEIAG